METIICAVFDEEDRATEAVEQIVQSGVKRNLVSAVVHTGEPVVHQDLPPAATQAARRTVQGGVLGATIGAVLGGLLAGPGGLLVSGPIAAALLGAGGGIYGGLAGSLAGREDLKPELRQRLEDLKEHEVLVAVDMEAGESSPEEIRETLVAHGGRAASII